VVKERPWLWSSLRLLYAAMIASLACLTVDGDGEHRPFRDDWRVEVDAEFPYLVDGEINISSIAIGGLLQDDNFANRGDVIVDVDGPEGRILVEMRRFTWREKRGDAEADFDKLELLAHTGGVKPPHEIPDENKCGLRHPGDPDSFSPWQDGCSIRLYYRGQTQPSRVGADIRVTLPASYRGAISIVTDDNDESEEYLNRGDVCVEGLNGNLDARLENGLAYVILDRDATPGPTCDEGAIEDCEEWPDGAWGSECACKTFGMAKVVATGAADITIDAPDPLWASFSLDNQGDNQTVEEHCDADVDWSDAEVEPTDREWKKHGEANHPSDAAPPGAGFSLRAVAEDCSVVQHTDDPEEFVGPNNADEQASEQRGNIVLCAGCLGGDTCEDLLE